MALPLSVASTCSHPLMEPHAPASQVCPHLVCSHMLALRNQLRNYCLDMDLPLVRYPHATAPTWLCWCTCTLLT